MHFQIRVHLWRQNLMDFNPSCISNGIKFKPDHKWTNMPSTVLIFEDYLISCNQSQNTSVSYWVKRKNEEGCIHQHHHGELQCINLPCQLRKTCFLHSGLRQGPRHIPKGHSGIKFQQLSKQAYNVFFINFFINFFSFSVPSPYSCSLDSSPNYSLHMMILLWMLVLISPNAK